MLGLDPHQLGLGARGRQFLALPQIGCEGHYHAAIMGLQPFQDDAGVEPPRIGEDDALDGLGHGCNLWRGRTRARLSGSLARRNGWHRITTPADPIAPPRHRSEEHTSELQSLMRISYAVFCLQKKKKHQKT